MKHLMFIMLSFSFLSCSGLWESEARDFTYDDLVGIFALSSYIKDYKRIESHLVPSYEMDKVINQKGYSTLLFTKVNTEGKRAKFLKETIDYYISFKSSNSNLVVSYYKDGAYNKKRKFFDSNYRIEGDNASLPSIYWRVEEFKGSYIKSKQLYKMLLFSKAYYVSSGILERYYYDEYKRILKKEFFDEGARLRKQKYYHNSREIL